MQKGTKKIPGPPKESKCTVKNPRLLAVISGDWNSCTPNRVPAATPKLMGVFTTKSFDLNLEKLIVSRPVGGPFKFLFAFFLITVFI